VLPENHRSITLLQKSEYKLSSRLEEDAYHFEIEFPEH